MLRAAPHLAPAVHPDCALGFSLTSRAARRSCIHQMVCAPSHDVTVQLGASERMAVFGAGAELTVERGACDLSNGQSNSAACRGAALVGRVEMKHLEDAWKRLVIGGMSPRSNSDREWILEKMHLALGNRLA